MSTDATLNKYSLEYAYSDLCYATSNFDLSQQLGSGSFGAVFRGVRRDGTEVAIKALDLPDESGFEEEVRVLSKFRHPNLVILMGFGRRDASRFLVYELLGGGDVYQRLQKSHLNQQSFTWKERCSTAVDAACGLSHLHNSTPKVYHRDIKTANILLDRNGTAKMADFGLACLSHSKSHKVDNAAGTTGYACPLYAKRSIVTEGSEVYSFGMVMLEMLTGSPPAVVYQAGDGSQQCRFLVCEIHGSVDIAVSMADANARWPVTVAQGLARFALRCADEQEENRPDFAEIVHQLRALRDYTPPQAPLRSQLQERGRVYTQSQAVMPPLIPFNVQPVMRVQQQPQPQPQLLRMTSYDEFAEKALQQPQPQLEHQKPQPQVPRMIPLWQLKCIAAEDPSVRELSHDSLVIKQWQEVGSSLCTTLRVGRLFQDDFLSKIAPGSANLVSREHFQIWAEPLNMPGVLESSTASVPCCFFLTNYSANGTIVNGTHYAGKMGQVAIHSGDTISIPQMIMTDEGPMASPIIQFQFDLSGSILRDCDFSLDSPTGTMGGA